MVNLIPDFRYTRLFEVDLALLSEKGIKHLLLDLDNTLTKWKDNNIDPETVAWVRKAADLGMKMCIVSNSNGVRAEIVAGKLGIEFIKNAGKPFPGGIERAMVQLGGVKESTVMIGDQLYTDILGGKRAGVYTVLLEPIHKREFIYTRCVRLFEKRKLKALGIRG